MTGHYGVPAGFISLVSAEGAEGANHDEAVDFHTDEQGHHKHQLSGSPVVARRTTFVRLDRGKAREAFETLLHLAGGDGLKLLVAIANHVSESDPIRYGIPDMLLRRVLLQVKSQAAPRPAPLVPTRPRSVSATHGLFGPPAAPVDKGADDTSVAATMRARASSACSISSLPGGHKQEEGLNGQPHGATRDGLRSGRRASGHKSPHEPPLHAHPHPPRPLTPRMDALARKPALDNQPLRLEAEISSGSNVSGAVGSSPVYRPLPLPGASLSSTNLATLRVPEEGDKEGEVDGAHGGEAEGEEEQGSGGGQQHRGSQDSTAGVSAGEADEDPAHKVGEDGGSSNPKDGGSKPTKAHQALIDGKPTKAKKKKKGNKSAGKAGSSKEWEAKDVAGLESQKPSTALGHVAAGSSNGLARRLSGAPSSRSSRSASAGVTRGPGREASGDRLGAGWNFSEVSIPAPQADWQETMTVEEVERCVHLKKWLEHKKEVERQRQHAKWRRIQKDLKWLRDMRIAQNQRNRALQEHGHTSPPLSPKAPLSFEQQPVSKEAEEEFDW